MSDAFGNVPATVADQIRAGGHERKERVTVMIQAGSLVARYVGRTDQPYDFESGGERIKGVKRRAYFTGEDLQVTEVEVREDTAGLLDSLKFGQVYQVTAEPRAKGNRVVWVLLNVEPAS